MTLLSYLWFALQYSDALPIVAQLPKHQIRFDHIPNRSLGSIPVMTLGALPVVPIGSFNVVTGTVPVIQVGDCPFELFPAFPPTLFANSTN